MPYMDKEKRRLYNRQYHVKYSAKCKQFNLCTQCGGKSDSGFSLCAKCNLKNNTRVKRDYSQNSERIKNYQNKRRQSFKKENKCSSCGAPLLEGESNICLACRCDNKHPYIPRIKGVIKYETAS